MMIAIPHWAYLFKTEENIVLLQRMPLMQWSVPTQNDHFMTNKRKRIYEEA